MGSTNCASITLGDRVAPADQLAIALPPTSGGLAGPQITFGALRRRIAEFQRGIERAGLRPGDRVVMLFPVIRILWNRYMRSSMRIIKARAEKEIQTTAQMATGVAAR